MPVYHVWFATKRRKWFLQEDIAEAVKEFLVSIAMEKEIDLLECETMIDHVHLLLRADDNEHLSKAMNLLKGASSRRVFERFPEFPMDTGTIRFWQHRFGSRVVPEDAITRVGAYIRTQDLRPDKYER